MNKNGKKIGASVLAMLLMMSSASLVACGGGKTIGEEVDANRSQLYVMNFNGGYGNIWIEKVKERFEEAYKDVSYESGKTGVQIMIQPAKEKGAGLDLKGSNCEVFFGEEVPYFSYVSQNMLLSLDDVVETVIAQDGVDLSEHQKKSLTALDGHYYALPHNETGAGLIYDKDLFNEKQLYINRAHDDYVAWEQYNAEDPEDYDLSEGPDGVFGTIDDGLPATMEEFFALCEYMKEDKGVTPFVVTGGSAPKYSANLVNRVAAAYNGYETTLANYTFSAEDVEVITDKDSIVKADNALGYTYETTTVDIDNTNGYLLRQTVGKLYGLAFLNKMIEGDYFYSPAMGSGVSQLMAQAYFLNSKFINEPIAMLVEGIWWENEADNAGTFADCDRNYVNAAKKDRNFGFMPMPTRIDENDTNTKGNPYCSYDMYSSYAFAKKTTSEWKIKLIKDFLKFTYSAAELEEYTKLVGVPRAMEYNLSTDAYNALTTFGKDLWDSHKAGQAVVQLSDNRLYYENESDHDSLVLLAANGITYPYTAFAKSSPTSVKNYFTGTWMKEDKWNDKYSKYFS
jgi:ABC-type glycerol-3-phosphate transport system substrate-binding protein